MSVYVILYASICPGIQQPYYITVLLSLEAHQVNLVDSTAILWNIQHYAVLLLCL